MTEAPAPTPTATSDSDACLRAVLEGFLGLLLAIFAGAQAAELDGDVAYLLAKLGQHRAR